MNNQNTNMSVSMLPTANLYHHPQNPRFQYEDIEDLAQSMRTMGVLQNLTVVPFNEVDHAGLKPNDPGNAYVVIIGNRRLEGAMMAGLETVPCAISAMSLSDQLKTMIVENNQRKDADPRKEGELFQLMLDLGDTVDSIASKTGLSAPTIRNRVKLLDLDEDKFRAAQERGVTLFDLAKLNQLDSKEAKNTVLAAAGTKNWERELLRATEQQKKERYIEAAVAVISQFATEIPDSNSAPCGETTYHGRYGAWTGKKPEDIKRPDNADVVSYYYYFSCGDIVVVRDAKLTESEAAEKAAKEAVWKEKRDAKEKRENEIKELSRRCATLRHNFVAGLSETFCKKNFGEIVDFQLRAIRNLSDAGLNCTKQQAMKCSDKLLAKLLNVPMDGEDIDELELSRVSVAAPHKVALCTAIAMNDKPSMSYIGENWNSEKQRYDTVYKVCDELDATYALLHTFGYEMSDEEEMLQNGNHPIFDTDEDTKNATAPDVSVDAMPADTNTTAVVPSDGDSTVDAAPADHGTADAAA